MEKMYRSFWNYWWQENRVAVICAVFCTLFSLWGPVNKIDGIMRFVLLATFIFSMLYILRKTWICNREYY